MVWSFRDIVKQELSSAKSYEQNLLDERSVVLYMAAKYCCVC